MSLHRLSVRIIQAVFEAAHNTVKGKGYVDWIELKDYQFGWRVLDSSKRIVQPVQVVLADKPPYKLDNPLQISMWEASCKLKREQIVRLYNDLIALIDGTLQGFEEQGKRYYKFTEKELEEYKFPLLAQINHFKERAVAAEQNYATLQEIHGSDITRYESRIRELEEANRALRDAPLHMSQDNHLSRPAQSKSRKIVVEKTTLHAVKPRAKKERV